MTLLSLPPLPAEFPHKGEYRVWDKHWNPAGFASTPQHPGQQPVRLPLEWTPLQCFLEGTRD